MAGTTKDQVLLRSRWRASWMGRSGRSSAGPVATGEKILQEDREKLFQVVEFLLAHETMSGAQFKACMEADMDAKGPGSLFDPI